MKYHFDPLRFLLRYLGSWRWFADFNNFCFLCLNLFEVTELFLLSENLLATLQHWNYERIFAAFTDLRHYFSELI